MLIQYSFVEILSHLSCVEFELSHATYLNTHISNFQWGLILNIQSSFTLGGTLEKSSLSLQGEPPASQPIVETAGQGRKLALLLVLTLHRRSTDGK